MAPINNPDFNVVTPDTFASARRSAAAAAAAAVGATAHTPQPPRVRRSRPRPGDRRKRVLAFLDKIPQDVDDWDVEIPEDEELDRIRDLLTLAHIDATRRATMHWEVLLLECTEHLRSDALQADKGLAGFFVLVVLAACEVFLTSDRVRLTAAKDEVNNALRLFLRSRPFVSEHVELGDETLKKFRSGCVMGTTVLSMLARICLGNRAFVIPLLILRRRQPRLHQTLGHQRAAEAASVFRGPPAEVLYPLARARAAGGLPHELTTWGSSPSEIREVLDMDAGPESPREIFPIYQLPPMRITGEAQLERRAATWLVQQARPVRRRARAIGAPGLGFPKRRPPINPSVRPSVRPAARRQRAAGP
ncbi:hypothetical protein Purlil1_3275 [Purpureocillium lilacinum]|uniref:Uncharacterized protein n=1 Tax=Purpureocillium lilacinum TaxID=33203 RepID=A0ABR0C8D3_PURLI|nr:hypothetical protein Purlil1_3275 [Purpureocillium lilacinum]